MCGTKADSNVGKLQKGVVQNVLCRVEWWIGVLSLPSQYQDLAISK